VFDTAAEFDLESLRKRLTAMDDAALLRFGKAAAFMASPEAYWNAPPRQVFIVQRDEARAEWRRRQASRASD
jgi:hypothetical protein